MKLIWNNRRPMAYAWRGRSALLNVASMALIATSLTSQPVYAADEKPEASDTTLEEILVTARKREERLIDTPISITAITEATIDKRNLKNLTGLSQVVPNLVFDLGTGSTGGSSNAQIFVRGIGQVDFLFTSDPGVGLYIDGVYYPRGTGVVMDMIDLERIEVLRGPQGTLFGKNTIGGAINITSKKPDDEFAANAVAVLGSRKRLDVQGSVNIPMVAEKLSMRLSGSFRTQDGYVKRVNVGDTLGDIESLYGRMQLRWTPSSTFTADLSADITRKRDASVAGELIDVRASDPSNAVLGLWNALVAPTFGPGVQMDRRFLSPDYQTQATGPNFSNFDMFGISLTMENEFSDTVSIKSISAYRKQDSQFGDDTDHSPYKYTESTNDNKHKQFSQELQLTGKSLGSRLNWVVGSFYMHEKGSDLFDVALGSGLFDALEALPGAIIPLAPVVCPPPVGVFAPCAGGPGNPINAALDLDILITDDIKINSYALFGELNFELVEKMVATAGLRYSHDKKTFTTSLFRQNAGLMTLPPTTVSDSWGSFSPRFGLKYNFSDNAMMYGSITGGFKSGGFNGRSTSLEQVASFNPEKVWSYELGYKTKFLDNRVGVNIAAFYNDYTDMQLTSVRDVGGVIVVVTENAGEVEIKGFEAEFVATPIAGLNLNGSIGYLDAKYKKLSPTATVRLGDDLVKTPKFTIHSGFDYGFDISENSEIRFGASIYYRSSFVNEPTNDPDLAQSGYALVDAFVEYSGAKDTWSLTLFGTNLSNKRYKTNGLNSYGSFGNSVANFAPPREWGVKLKMKF